MDEMRNQLECRIAGILSSYPQILYGYTAITYSSYAKQYQSALVFAVPYAPQLFQDNYSETGLEESIARARKTIDQILPQIERVLRSEKVAYYIPPVAQSSETELVAPFSFKYAATKAGIGWIGKNDVVITEKYGPRIRLSAILIDSVFTYGIPYQQSQCPESCQRCVSICPYHALTGKQWDDATQRAQMIDYQLCNQKRSLFIGKLGRKSACGLCLTVCPYGQTVEV